MRIERESERERGRERERERHNNYADGYVGIHAGWICIERKHDGRVCREREMIEMYVKREREREGGRERER